MISNAYTQKISGMKRFKEQIVRTCYQVNSVEEVVYNRHHFLRIKTKIGIDSDLNEFIEDSVILKEAVDTIMTLGGSSREYMIDIPLCKDQYGTEILLKMESFVNGKMKVCEYFPRIPVELKKKNRADALIILKNILRNIQG